MLFSLNELLSGNGPMNISSSGQWMESCHSWSFFPKGLCENTAVLYLTVRSSAMRYSNSHCVLFIVGVAEVDVYFSLTWSGTQEW